MNFLYRDASLLIVAGVVAVAAFALILFYYDSISEAKENRMKWLLRNRFRSAAALGADRKWKADFLGNRRDLLVALAVSLLAALILLVFSQNIPLIIGLSIGIFVLSCAGIAYLHKRHDRKKFEAAFPEAVEMLTRSVRTGVPLDEAFMSLSERFEGELARRFEVFQSQLALGQPFREAGVNFCRGLNMPDVEFFFAVLSLNRESGSELTPALEAMSYTLRERQKIRRRATVLTSEIRSSAKVMAGLPFVFSAVMFVINPGMLEFYLHDTVGQIILGLCVLSILVGMVLIRDIANIDD